MDGSTNWNRNGEWQQQPSLAAVASYSAPYHHQQYQYQQPYPSHMQQGGTSSSSTTTAIIKHGKTHSELVHYYTSLYDSWNKVSLDTMTALNLNNSMGGYSDTAQRKELERKGQWASYYASNSSALAHFHFALSKGQHPSYAERPASPPFIPPELPASAPASAPAPAVDPSVSLSVLGQNQQQEEQGQGELPEKERSDNVDKEDDDSAADADAHSSVSELGQIQQQQGREEHYDENESSDDDASLFGSDDDEEEDKEGGEGAGEEESSDDDASLFGSSDNDEVNIGETSTMSTNQLEPSDLYSSEGGRELYNGQPAPVDPAPQMMYPLPSFATATSAAPASSSFIKTVSASSSGTNTECINGRIRKSRWGPKVDESVENHTPVIDNRPHQYHDSCGTVNDSSHEHDDHSHRSENDACEYKQTMYSSRSDNESHELSDPLVDDAHNCEYCQGSCTCSKAYKFAQQCEKRRLAALSFSGNNGSTSVPEMADVIEEDNMGIGLGSARTPEMAGIALENTLASDSMSTPGPYMLGAAGQDSIANNMSGVTNGNNSNSPPMHKKSAKGLNPERFVKRLVRKVALWSGGDEGAIKRAEDAVKDMPSESWPYHCPIPGCGWVVPTEEIMSMHLDSRDFGTHKSYYQQKCAIDELSKELGDDFPIEKSKLMALAVKPKEVDPGEEQTGLKRKVAHAFAVASAKVTQQRKNTMDGRREKRRKTNKDMLIEDVTRWAAGDEVAVKRAVEMIEQIPQWSFDCPACFAKFPTQEILDMHLMGMMNKRHKKFRKKHQLTRKSSASASYIASIGVKNKMFINMIAMWSGGDDGAVKRASNAVASMTKKSWCFSCPVCSEKFPTEETRDLHVICGTNKPHQKYQREGSHYKMLLSRAQSVAEPSIPSCVPNFPFPQAAEVGTRKFAREQLKFRESGQLTVAVRFLSATRGVAQNHVAQAQPTFDVGDAPNIEPNNEEVALPLTQGGIVPSQTTLLPHLTQGGIAPTQTAFPIDSPSNTSSNAALGAAKHPARSNKNQKQAKAKNKSPQNGKKKKKNGATKKKTKAQKKLEEQKKLFVNNVRRWSGNKEDVVTRAERAIQSLKKWPKKFCYHCPVPDCQTSFPRQEFLKLHVEGVQNKKHKAYRLQRDKVSLDQAQKENNNEDRTQSDNVGPSKWKLIIDTCCLVNDKGLGAERLIKLVNRVMSQQNVRGIDMVIPFKVWSELEHQSKSYDQNRAYAAREVMRILRKNLETNITANEENILRSQTLRESQEAASKFLPRDLRQSTNDDHILACAMLEKEHASYEPEFEVLVVTQDNNLACKCLSNGLKVEPSLSEFSNKYERRMSVLGNDQHVPALSDKANAAVENQKVVDLLSDSSDDEVEIVPIPPKKIEIIELLD